MKRLIVVMIVCLFALMCTIYLIELTCVPKHAESEIDLANQGMGLSQPLPKQFAGLIDRNPKKDLIPVGIYLYKKHKLFFACVGLAFLSDTNGGVTLMSPEHLFGKGERMAYAIRLATSTNNYISYFIDHVESRSKDNKGLDVAFSALGSKPRVIEGFFEGQYERNVSVFATNAVVFDDKKVEHIYSYITDKEVLLLGYSATNQTATPSNLLIETINGNGYSGSPFYDEYGRFYILEAGMHNDGLLNTLNVQFKNQLHRDTLGVAYITGPFEFY